MKIEPDFQLDTVESHGETEDLNTPLPTNQPNDIHPVTESVLVGW